MYQVSDDKVDMPARVAEQIRELISRGVLSPGVHLGQTELADRFETSRAPVREALKLLASEGTLQHDKNRGFFVAQFSSDEVRQLYRLRELVEGEVLESVVWPDEAKLAVLQQQLDHLLSLEKLQPEWVQAHRAFHDAVFDLSDQKWMVREVRRLWALTDRYRSLLFATLPKERRSNAKTSDQARMLKALVQRDAKGLRKIIDDIRNGSRDQLIQLLRERGL